MEFAAARKHVEPRGRHYRVRHVNRKWALLVQVRFETLV